MPFIVVLYVWTFVYSSLYNWPHIFFCTSKSSQLVSVAEIGWISICTGRPWTACGHSCLPSGWSAVVGRGPGLRWRCWCYQRPCGLMPGVSPPLWRMQIWMCVGGGPDCSDNNRQAGRRALMLADGVTPLWFVTTKTFGLCSYWFFFLL